jgi:hypothetical protein
MKLGGLTVTLIAFGYAFYGLHRDDARHPR